MANIVSHVVTVTGSPEAVRAFADRMIVRRAGATFDFDFDALAPMPAALRGTEGSSTASEGLILLGEDGLPDPLISTKTVGEQAARMLEYPWVVEAGATDRAGLDALLRRRAAADGGVERRLALGRAAVAAFRETGHVTAGPWAVENWGCAYVLDIGLVRDEPGRLEFTFGTPWSSPDRIWDRIAEAFPEVVVDVLGFEEAWHFAVDGRIAGGRNEVREVEPTPELYERVYGKPYVEEPEGADEPAAAAPIASFEPAPRSAERASSGVWRMIERVNWDVVGWALAALVLAYYVLWR